MTSKSYILYSALAALSAFAASVPQNSADKYYFTVPLHPGGIKGVVMGDPPDYRVMRSEDIDWLNEAAAERRALFTGTAPSQKVSLVPEFGRWPVTATNGFEGWASAVFSDNGDVQTNLVARYSYRTNDLSGSLRMIQKGPAVKTGRGGLIPKKTIGEYGGRYHYVLTGLGIENPTNLISDYSVTEASPNGSFVWPSETNITTMTVTNWTGSYKVNGRTYESVRTNISYLTMNMTNGTVSVHTNMWVEILPHVETVNLTNIVEHSKAGMIFKSGAVEDYEPGVPRDLEGPFSTDGIKAWYDVLRNAKFNHYSGSAVVNLNETNYWYTTEWSQDGNEGTETNTIHNGQWGYKEVTVWKLLYNGISEVYEWVEDPESGEQYEKLVDLKPDPTDVTYGGEIENGFNSYGTYDISIPLSYDIVHTGDVSRVNQATLFAFVNVMWDQSWWVGGKYIDEIGSTNIRYVVAIRQQGVQELPGGVDDINGTATNKLVAFRCTIDMGDLLEQAASLCGHQFPSYGFSQSPKFPCPDAWIYKPGSNTFYWETKSGSSGTTETFSASMESAILVIEFAPWTSLSGW